MSEVIFTIVKVCAFGRLPLSKIQGVVREVFDRFENLGIRYTPKVVGQVERTYAKVCETYAPPAPKGVAAHRYIERFNRLHDRLPKPRELADFAAIDKNTAKTALKRFRKSPPKSETVNQLQEQETHPMNNQPTITTFPLLYRTFRTLDLNHKPTQAQVDEMMAESPWRFRPDGDEQAAAATNRYAEYVKKTRKTVPQSYKWYRDKLITTAHKDIAFLEATTHKPLGDEHKSQTQEQALDQNVPALETDPIRVPEAAEAAPAPVPAEPTPPLEVPAAQRWTPEDAAAEFGFDVEDIRALQLAP